MCESIEKELSNVLGDFGRSIALLETLNQAVAARGNDTELELSIDIDIAIDTLNAAHGRLDYAVLRLDRLRLEREGKLVIDNTTG